MEEREIEMHNKFNIWLYWEWAKSKKEYTYTEQERKEARESLEPSRQELHKANNKNII